MILAEFGGAMVISLPGGKIGGWEWPARTPWRSRNKWPPRRKRAGKSSSASRNDGHREIETDDGMNRENQRRRQSGQQKYSDSYRPQCRAEPRQPKAKMPKTLRVRDAWPLSRMVARSGIKPTYQNTSGDGQIRRDRENVPDQRTAELRPHSHGVGNGNSQ